MDNGLRPKTRPSPYNGFYYYARWGLSELNMSIVILQTDMGQVTGVMRDE